jgi:hypothetical protein
MALPDDDVPVSHGMEEVGQGRRADQGAGKEEFSQRLSNENWRAALMPPVKRGFS